MSNDGNFYIHVTNFRNHVYQLKNAYSNYNKNYEQFLNICSKMDQKWNDNLTSAFLGMISKEQLLAKAFYESFMEHCDQDLAFSEKLVGTFNRYDIVNLQSLEFYHNKIVNAVNIMKNQIMRGIFNVLNNLSPMTENKFSSRSTSRWYDREEKKWYRRSRTSSAIWDIDAVKATFDRINDEVNNIIERYEGIDSSVCSLIENSYIVISRINPNLMKDNQMKLVSTIQSAVEKELERKDVRDYNVQNSKTKIEITEAERVQQDDMGAIDSSKNVEVNEIEREQVTDMIDNVSIDRIDNLDGQRTIINHFTDGSKKIKVDIDNKNRELPNDYSANTGTETLDIGSVNHTDADSAFLSDKKMEVNIRNTELNSNENEFKNNSVNNDVNIKNEVNNQTVSDYNYSSNNVELNVGAVENTAPVGEYTASSDQQGVSLGNVSVGNVSKDLDSSSLENDINMAISNSVGSNH